MSYQNYLRSSHWKQKRQEVLFLTNTTKAGEKRCQICLNASNEFHIHHFTYKNICDEHLKDLKAFCPKCHKVFHAFQSKFGIDKNDKKRNRALFRAIKSARDFPRIGHVFNYPGTKNEYVRLKFLELTKHLPKKSNVILRKKAA